MNFGNSDHLAHRISIFEKPRAQATSSKFQTPSSKEAPSSKLKNRAARRLPRHLFLGFVVLRFGTSLELGVGVRCGLHLMQIMQSSFSPSPTPSIPGEV